MLVVDAHLDLAMNALIWNRDLNVPVHETRELEIAAGLTKKGYGRGTVAFPEMRRGGVAVCIATLIARVQKPGNPWPGFRAPEIAFAAAQGASSSPEALGALQKAEIEKWWPVIKAMNIQPK